MRFGDALAHSAGTEMASGDLEQAERWFRRAVEIQPYRLSHRTSLIEFLLGKNALSEAEAAYSLARDSFDDRESLSTLESLGDRLQLLKAGRRRIEGPRALRTDFVGRTAEFSSLASEWRGPWSGASPPSWCGPFMGFRVQRA